MGPFVINLENLSKLRPKTPEILRNLDFIGFLLIIIRFQYNARSDWLKQRTLSENKEQVNDIKCECCAA